MQLQLMQELDATGALGVQNYAVASGRARMEGTSATMLSNEARTAKAATQQL